MEGGGMRNLTKWERKKEKRTVYTNKVMRITYGVTEEQSASSD